MTGQENQDIMKKKQNIMKKFNISGQTVKPGYNELSLLIEKNNNSSLRDNED